MSVAVLGGGLGGLSTAFYLTRKFPNYKITLIESSKRTGGWIKSRKLKNGVVFEQAARTIRPGGIPGQNTLALIDQLNLQNEINPLLSIHPAAKNRMIYANGKLHLLPNSLSSLLKKQEPFSKPLLRYLINDLFASKEKLEDDSLYNFSLRRFGPEFTDYLISTMVCGISGSNSKEITVKFLMRQLFEYEQQYGSIASGLVRNIFKKTPKTNGTLSELEMRAKRDRWSIFSLNNGLETLTTALHDNILKNNVDVVLNEHCEELNLSSSGVKLSCGKNYEVNHLVSTIPARSLGKLLENQHPQLAQLLNKIPTVSMAVVNLYYKENLLKDLAFGFLVPPKEKLPILGVIYDSCVQSYSNGTILTVMMGGSWYEQYFGRKQDKEHFLNTAKQYLSIILGIDVEPTNFKVNILKDCIPQYVVGHYENLDKIHDYIEDKKLPISLCGASYYGVGVNDVILGGKNVVNKIQIDC